MARCIEFYEKWEKDPHWCDKCPEAVRLIDNYLDLVRELEDLGIDRETTFVGLPEGSARPLLAEKEDKVREKAIEKISEDLKGKQHAGRGHKKKITHRDVKKIIRRIRKDLGIKCKIEDKLEVLKRIENIGIILSTLWNIGSRENYAGDKDFHGNCPPQIVEQCVLRLTKKGDKVVDPMVGSGTTIDVCKVLERECIGYDISPEREDIIKNDSKKIPLENNSVDMVFLHPPYWDMVFYTNADDPLAKEDLSRAKTFDGYFEMLDPVLCECYRILKNEKYMCILLGDRIKKGEFYPLCRKAANLAEIIGFKDCGYSIKFTENPTSKIEKGKTIYAELAFTNNLKIDHDIVMFFKKEENVPN